MLTIFALAGNGLLLVLLVVSMMRKPKADDAPSAPAAKSPAKTEAH